MVQALALDYRRIVVDLRSNLPDRVTQSAYYVLATAFISRMELLVRLMESNPADVDMSLIDHLHADVLELHPHIFQGGTETGEFAEMLNTVGGMTFAETTEVMERTKPAKGR